MGSGSYYSVSGLPRLRVWLHRGSTTQTQGHLQPSECSSFAESHLHYYGESDTRTRIRPSARPSPDVPWPTAGRRSTLTCWDRSSKAGVEPNPRQTTRGLSHWVPLKTLGSLLVSLFPRYLSSGEPKSCGFPQQRLNEFVPKVREKLLTETRKKQRSQSQVKSTSELLIKAVPKLAVRTRFVRCLVTCTAAFLITAPAQDFYHQFHF